MLKNAKYKIANDFRTLQLNNVFIPENVTSAVDVATWKERQLSSHSMFTDLQVPRSIFGLHRAFGT